jgi:hypothetical protein
MIDMQTVLTALAREQQRNDAVAMLGSTAPLLVFDVGIPKGTINSEHRLQVSHVLCKAHGEQLVEITGHVLQRGAGTGMRLRARYRLTDAGYRWLRERVA